MAYLHCKLHNNFDYCATRSQLEAATQMKLTFSIECDKLLQYLLDVQLLVHLDLMMMMLHLTLRLQRTVTVSP